MPLCPLQICASEDADVDLDFESERQVLVMWDDTTEGACDYVNTELLNILDDSAEIGRGTRVSMLWNNEEWAGRVPFVDERLSKWKVRMCVVFSVMYQSKC